MTKDTLDNKYFLLLASLRVPNSLGGLAIIACSGDYCIVLILI